MTHGHVSSLAGNIATFNAESLTDLMHRQKLFAHEMTNCRNPHNLSH